MSSSTFPKDATLVSTLASALFFQIPHLLRRSAGMSTIDIQMLRYTHTHRNKHCMCSDTHRSGHKTSERTQRFGFFSVRLIAAGTMTVKTFRGKTGVRVKSCDYICEKEVLLTGCRTAFLFPLQVLKWRNPPLNL